MEVFEQIRNVFREHPDLKDTEEWPEKVKIVEVSPRDGLQNEKELIGTETKIALIDRLSKTGLLAIEATSFVSPKWVPQMADAADVMMGITKEEGVSYQVLTPNMKGLELAICSGATEIAVFAAASESFSKNNINCSIEDSLERYDELISTAINSGLKVRAYVSWVMGCPYEGDVGPK